MVFVVADEARKEEMRHKTYHRLALRELKKPERLIDLAEHQGTPERPRANSPTARGTAS